jgi:hypothetical protein
LNRPRSSKTYPPQPLAKFVSWALAALVGVAAVAETSSAQTFRFRNETDSKLIAYRAGDGAEPVEVKEATLEPGASGFAPEPNPESVYYAPEAKRGLAMAVAVAENDDSDKSATLSVRRFEGAGPWPAADPRTASATWKLAPGLPTVVTLTKDWEILVRPVIPTGIVVKPSTIPGGYPVRAEITFSSPSAGTPIMLESSNPEIAAVPENAETDGVHLSFPVTTFDVDDERKVEISVISAGVRETATLTVEHREVQVVAVTFNRRNLIGGEPVLGTVHVKGMTEDTEPVTVKLSAQDKYASVPETVVVNYAPRISKATFDIETKPVPHLRKGGVNAVIGDGDEKWGGFTLTPLVPESFSADRDSVQPGESFEAALGFRITPEQPASIVLSASPEGLVDVPAKVALQPGDTRVAVPVSVRSGMEARAPVTVTIKAAMEAMPELARELSFEVIQ